MNNVIKHIIIFDKFSNLPEHSSRLIFYYNNRVIKKLKWIQIMWVPFPEIIQKYILYLYNSNKLEEQYFENLRKNYSDIVNKTNYDINEKTFVKFMFDLNYLNKETLLLLSVQSQYKQINPGIVINCNNYYSLKDSEKQKIKECKENEIFEKSYNFISQNIDTKIIKKFGYFIRELVKINDDWWLITTGYVDRIVEDEESQKLICWIFSEII